MALLAGRDEARKEAIRTLESYGRPTDGHGHIFNLGHGINQFTPPENVQALVETVHDHSRKQRLTA
jgi:uroporphyrinogen decarboxylase